MIKKLQALKAKKGFTLVELIVVIAIIGILAAILIPMMMGYIQQANVTAADQNAASIKNILKNVLTKLDGKGCTITAAADTITYGTVKADGTGDATGAIYINIKDGQGEDKFTIDTTENKTKGIVPHGTNPSTDSTWTSADVYKEITNEFNNSLGDMAAGYAVVFLNKGNEPIQAVWTSDLTTIGKITGPIQKWDGTVGVIDGIVVGTNNKVNATAADNTTSSEVE